MKLKRNMVILVLVILVLLAGFYFISHYDPKQEEPEYTYTPEVSVFETQVDQIASVSVSLENESYRLVSCDGVWMVEGDALYKLNQMLVMSLLYDCADVTAKEILEEAPADLTVYGLDKPKRSVLITLTDGTKRRIDIGDATIDGSLFYVMTDEKSTVYAKTATTCDNLAVPLSKLLDDTVYSIAEEEFGGFSLEKPNTEKIVLVRRNTAQPGEDPVYQWYMEAPLIKSVSLYTLKTGLLEKALSQTFVEADTRGASLGDVTAVYTLWNQDHSVTYRVKVGQTTGDLTAIQLEGDKTVYRVETDKVSFAKLGYMEFADKTVHVEELIKIDKVSIDGKGKSYILTAEGSGNSGRYTVNGEAVDNSAFKSAYKTVIGLTMDGYTTKSVSNEPEFVITYTRKDGTENQVTAVHFDERNYLVRVNGEGNLLVRKNQFDAILDAFEKF